MMVKSSASVKLPKEQRCQFLIGPASSWFFPSNTDIWTQPTAPNLDDNLTEIIKDEPMECCEEEASLSYFIYGSIGCFCYGEIHHHPTPKVESQKDFVFKSELSNSTSASLGQLIDIKEDNSRVSCVRFLKVSRRPLSMILTENGSLLVHDCIANENLVHFKKAELITKFSSLPEMQYEETNSERSNKKPRFDALHQFSSCVWPSARNAFLGISLTKKKTNLLLWLRLKELDNDVAIQKSEIIESYEKIELNLPQYAKPICCMESTLIDSETCLIAVAMEDGLIVVVKLNLEQGQTKQVIVLPRHGKPVTSLSFLIDNETIQRGYQLGLLASVSRDGLVVLWDIQDERDFAFYEADEGRKKSINWFAAKFIPVKSTKQIHLAISNPNNSLTVLKLPIKKPSSTIIQLKEAKEKYQKKQNATQSALRHLAVIFNIVFDPVTRTIMTTSYDGNIILWKCHLSDKSTSDVNEIELKPEYLYPTMSDCARTHMIRHSSIRTDFVGLALGKGGVRFYKIPTNPINRRFDMSSSCNEIVRKITKTSLSPTSIAWHPNHEYRLAIGTLEGKVLRIDLTPRRATLIETEKRKPRRLTTSDSVASQVNDNIFDVEYEPLNRDDSQLDVLKQPSDDNKTDGIYSLSWGPNPCCPQDVSKMAIYAIGSLSHRLFIYENYGSKKDSGDDKEKLTDYLDEFLDESLPEAIGEATEVAWKSSMDLMALGTTHGKVIIVSYLDESHVKRSRNNLFQKLAVIQGPMGNTSIQCLAWHPTTKEDDQHYYYVAASAKESPAFVFNINESMLIADVKTKMKIQEGKPGDLSSEDATMTNTISSYVCKLDGHKKPISDIVWSPHKPNELATSSFDRFCFVWSLDDSIDTGARISSKFAGRYRLFTLEWSIVDENLIFTSGQDGTIWAWRPSENRCKNELA